MRRALRSITARCRFLRKPGQRATARRGRAPRRIESAGRHESFAVSGFTLTLVETRQTVTAENSLLDPTRWRCGRDGRAPWSVVLAAAWFALGCAASSGDGLRGQGGASSGAPTSGNGPTLGGNPGQPSVGRCTDEKRLACRRVDCPADSAPSTTSASGIVYDPAGRVPLYNAVVYVVDPSDLVSLPARVQCESCSAFFPEYATAVALTAADGSFRLTDMPVGSGLSLIVQLGKWRRVVKLPYITPCTNTVLDPELTRLPRSSAEGDLPKIAVTTGGSDALECLVKKLGVDESEFTPASGAGHVHLFSGYRAAATMTSQGKSLPLEHAEDLWSSADRMLDYDMMLMGCEGESSLWRAPEKVIPDDALPRPIAMQLEVRKYADLGGRIFGSHWHHRWINSDNTTPDNPYPPSGPAVASFAKSSGGVGDLDVLVDATFPKGLAFRDWLLNVGASKDLGKLPLVNAEHSVDSVTPELARRWIYGSDPEGVSGTTRVPDMVQYFSFTTPVGADECGRMVFSDVHVSIGGGKDADKPFPERCQASPDDELSPQEKALEFMIFDLSSCIQKENAEIRMPVQVK